MAAAAAGKDAAAAKVVLVVGPVGCGKTSLIRRFLTGRYEAGPPPPTIGFTDAAGSALLDITSERKLRCGLQELMPADGVQIVFWEIGGKDASQRCAPRRHLVDGVLVCFDAGDRASYQSAAHFLMQHRMNRHLEHHHAMSMGASRQAASPPRMAAVLCGTKAELADLSGGPAVDTAELREFVQKNAMQGMVYTSAVTGEGVDEAMHTLLAAALEFEEDAEAERLAAESLEPRGGGVQALPPALADTCAGANGEGSDKHRLVEVLQDGSSFSARPLTACLVKGLFHRAVHVWLHDAKAGALLLRRYHADSPKHPTCWGPTCHGEVLCQPSTQYGAAQAHHGLPELLPDAAKRIVEEQLLGGSGECNVDFEHWFTCESVDGTCREEIVVFVVPIIGTHGQVAGSRLLDSLKLQRGEAAQWVHFMNIFGDDRRSQHKLCFFADEYRESMLRRMRHRVVHHQQQEIR